MTYFAIFAYLLFGQDEACKEFLLIKIIDYGK
jgi:hypothetical protein